MTLKLKALLEGYAWERKADGSLPTLKDAIAVHEANKGAKPDYLDLDKDGDKEESMKSAAKKMNEYGEDEFDRDPEMYGGGKSSRESNGDTYEIVEKLEDYVDRLMQDLSTNSNVPTSEKSVILKQLVKISDLIDQLQDNI
jgi:hypothetical protein